MRHAGEMPIGLPTLVLLHGHGGDPSTFAALMRQRPVSAPIAGYGDRGQRSWWSPDSFGPTTDDVTTFPLPGGPIVIGGFSQGGAMAASLASHYSAIVGLIVVGGFLPDPPPKIDRAIDVLCAHSEDDVTVDPFLGARIARWAKGAGCSVTQVEYEGGHIWNTHVDTQVAAWMAANHFDG